MFNKLAQTSKKYILAILSAAILVPSLSLSFAYAASATTSGSSTSSSAGNKTLLNSILTKGANEIERRLTTLNGLDSRISSTTKLTASDKTSLTNEVNNEATGLTSLKATLAACTTLPCAESAAQSIFTEYRVYLLVLPQVQLVKTADSQQATEALLSTLATNLSSRVTASGNSTLVSDLSTMNSDISAAQSQSSSTETAVLGLTPTDYDTNHALLVQYYGDLKTAQTDISNASSLAKTIITTLTSSKSS